MNAECQTLNGKEKAATGFRLIIAGGGTGGHLFPGIAVASALTARLTDASILFVAGRRPMEKDILCKAGFDAVSIDVEGIKGRGWKKGVPVLLRLPKSIFQSAGVIRRFSPSVVLGVGGYSSGPFCTAAKLMGVPTAIHEQNSYPGVTNRLLSHWVDRIFVSFEQSRTCFRKGEPILTGNPVRPELQQARIGARSKTQPFTILVMGGSQGARAINRVFVEALGLMEDKRKDMAVIHQTGQGDYERVMEDYRHRGLEAEIEPFIADMASAYSRADLVIGRAGASTIFELAAAGKPSILIPYPHATNRHQEINAGELVGVGGAEMILEKDLTAEGLAGVMTRYGDDPSTLRKMGERAHQISRMDAADVIVDQLMEMDLRRKIS